MLEPMKNLGKLLHERIAQKVAPELLQPLEKRKPGKPRIGIAGDLSSRSGAAWAVGLLEHLDKSKLESFALKISGAEDAISYHMKDSADHYWRLAGHPLQIARFIRSLDLDYLIFTDIGDVSTEYQIGIFRLARVQALAWGSPFTSGMPTIDEFISSEWMEAPNGEEHYTERLVRLPKTGLTLRTIESVPLDLGRAHFGLPDGYLVGYPQLQVKWLPQWDDIIARIVSQTNGTLVTFDFHRPFARAVFQERMDRLGVPIVWMPYMSKHYFHHIMRLCDVNLDSPAWSGGLTAINALVAGAPMVTLPGQFLRQRLAAGFCRAAGVPGLIAKDEDDYVDLATNPERIRAAMATLNSAALFEDPAPVRALEQHVINSTI